MGRFVSGSEVRGSVALTGDDSLQVLLLESTVRAGCTLTGNAGSNGVSVEGNAIGSDLASVGNAPAPVAIGRSNTVGGIKCGQCAGL